MSGNRVLDALNFVKKMEIGLGLIPTEGASLKKEMEFSKAAGSRERGAGGDASKSHGAAVSCKELTDAATALFV